jgi:hypothetical protein
MPPTTKRTTDIAPATPDFQEVINLLAVLTEANNRMLDIEAASNTEFLEIIDDFKKEFAQCQEARTKAEAALETICRSHPEWFVNARSIKTPYGKVSFRATARLSIANEEATVRLIKAFKPKPHDYIRLVEEPNLEALEALDDADLEKLMIKRERGESFSATPARVDFGEALKKSEPGH